MVPLRFFRSACLLAVLLGSLAAMTAHADMFLASTASYVPINSFDSLQSACEAVQAGSTLQAMYTDTVNADVTQYMNDQSATQAFVAVYFTDNVGWYWHVTQMGEASTVAVSASSFVNGVLPDGTTGKYAIFSTATGKLQAVDGTTDYKALCYTEQLHTVAKKKFPWWAILIIVLGCVVIIAVVVVIVVCCCCCKNKKHRYTDDDDESAFTSRSGSFISRGTSRTGSSHTDMSSSSSLSSSGSSRSGSSKSSAVTGSTTSSSHTGSTSTGSSSVASSRSSASSSSLAFSEA